jgi:hypothetical protein
LANGLPDIGVIPERASRRIFFIIKRLSMFCFHDSNSRKSKYVVTIGNKSFIALFDELG